MYTLKEGKKRTIKAKVRRHTGAGPIVLTSPMRRIVDSARVLIAGFDWATASWDADINQLSAIFDASLAGLATPGTYYMQMTGVIGGEDWPIEIEVVVEDWGP